VDDRNTVEPSISLKSGHMTYGWTRALNGGGSVQAVYNPGETVDVTWKDNGANGVWNTKVRPEGVGARAYQAAFTHPTQPNPNL
jgi:hypothetical protein